MNRTTRSKMPLWLAVVAFAVLLALLGYAGYLERQQLDIQQQQYCRMVAGGYWPDYAGSFEQDCTPAGDAEPAQ